MDTFQVVSIHNVPIINEWKFETIYRETVIDGSVLIWTIGFDGSNIIMEFGQFGGAIQTTFRSIESKGGRTLIEQAHQEARIRYLNKLREGYISTEVKDIPRSKAMLCTHYMPFKSTLKFPVICQPKLDGIRMLVSQSNDKLYCMSRKGCERKFFQHIKKELRKFVNYFSTDCILDGELYSTKLTFSQLSGVVRSELEKDPHEIYMDYYIFDINTNDNKTFEERYELLYSGFKAYLDDLKTEAIESGDYSNWDNTYGSKYLKIVGNTYVYLHEQILELHRKYVNAGFEGTIIRRLGGSRTPMEIQKSMYKPTRVCNLLKYKDKESEEMIIIDYMSCEGKEKGLVKWIVRDIRGNITPVVPKGTFEERRILYQRGREFIGKLLTVEFQKLTEYGKPRNPVGIAIRDYE